MMLEYRTLGKTDLKVSSIGLGCVTFGREIDGAASFELLDRAVECGINLLDTAAAYGDGASEEWIGRWLRQRRPRPPVIVATKVSGRLTRENVFCSIDGSLRRLGVERIDLVQAHEWDAETPLEQILEAFDVLVQRGKIHYGGCSNWPPGEVQQALELAERRGWCRLESVQPRYSLVSREIEHELLPLCASREIGVITYSPLGAGFLTGKYRPGEPVPHGTRFDVKPGHQQIYFHPRMFQVVENLRRLAERTGLSMVRLALGWVLHRAGLTSVLVGARHVGQLDQALDSFKRPLEDWIVEELDAMSRPGPDAGK